MLQHVEKGRKGGYSWGICDPKFFDKKYYVRADKETTRDNVELEAGFHTASAAIAAFRNIARMR